MATPSGGQEHSLSDEATFAGRVKPPQAEMSLGAERTHALFMA